MAADAYPSTAMEPHVRVIDGYQAGCVDTTCGGLADRVWLTKWVRWCGVFRDTWIEARLDAVAHNIQNHPEPRLTWEEIVHGHLDEDRLPTMRPH